MDLLISVRSHYASKIANGNKTWEFRKRPPRDGVENVVIYSTKPESRIVAIAPMKEVKICNIPAMWSRNKSSGNPGCISDDKFFEYYGDRANAVALILGEVKKLDIPLKEILEVKPDFHPPQSYVYLDDESAIAQLIAQHREGLRCF